MNFNNAVCRKIIFSSCCFKPGLHISRKDPKHFFVNMFLIYPDMAWTPYRWNYCNKLLYCDKY